MAAAPAAPAAAELVAGVSGDRPCRFWFDQEHEMRITTLKRTHVCLTLLVLGLTELCLTGCASAPPAHSGPGIVYYCDGAGGGSGVRNWGRGVQQGFKQAGYAGEYVEFKWETGLGMIADEEEADKAKRAQGAKLAQQIQAYRTKFPGRTVDLVGLSAGTLIVAYALEALPAAGQVDTVVMLSSSIGADYNLSKALRHVQGDMYVTTSPHDAMLGDLAPLFGTADRQYVGRHIAGLTGFELPPGADYATRRVYAKIVNIAWEPELDKYGDYGGHTDTAKPAFVQHVVVPLLTQEGPRYFRVHASGTAATYKAVQQ
jgi:pimeloyl-ACP methyl ester carboxylesterase